jgi:hypothetical protein
MWAMLRNGSSYSLQNGVGEVINTRVNSLIIIQFRVEGNLGFQVGLEDNPVSTSDVWAIPVGAET